MATVSRNTYYKAAAALFVLLAVTIGVSYLPLGAFGPVAAVTVAGIKAAIIILFFMHVRYQSKLVWAFAAAGFLWLAIMFGLTFGDYLTREWLPITTWGASSVPSCGFLIIFSTLSVHPNTHSSPGGASCLIASNQRRTISSPSACGPSEIQGRIPSADPYGTR